MRVSFEVTICGQTFHLGTHPEDELDEIEHEAPAVVGTPSSVEFGFAPEPDTYWTEEDRGPRRRR